MRKFDFFVSLHFIDECLGNLSLHRCTALDLIRALQTMSIVVGFDRVVISCKAFPEPMEFCSGGLFSKCFDFTDLMRFY